MYELHPWPKYAKKLQPILRKYGNWDFFVVLSCATTHAGIYLTNICAEVVQSYTMGPVTEGRLS